MTELTAVATNLSPSDQLRALQGDSYLLLSAGKPLLGTELRIVEEEDAPVPNGTVGEIVVRGPQLTKGYWILPDATAEAMKGAGMHPAISDAAVIGVPDERWGEKVHAMVVLRDGHSATAEEIMDFCRGTIGGFQLPRAVEFIDELPRNASGKVLKRVLREPYWRGADRRVAGT